MTKSTHDVVIIGGAITGAAAAYFLAANPAFGGSVAVIERDPTYAHAATSHSASAVRLQFSNPVNVAMSRFSLDFMAGFAERMRVGDDAPELAFHPGGYLFLATTDSQAARMRENHAVQAALGAPISLLSSDDVRAAFPHMQADDITLASYGGDAEGWFDSSAFLNGFRAKARSLGVTFIKDEVTALRLSARRVDGVKLKSGAEISSGTVVNAAGTDAAALCAMAGIAIPVERRKRTLFAFACEKSPEGGATINQGRLPFVAEPNGVYCRPEGRNFIAGCPPVEDPVADPDDFTPRHAEFEDIIWPTLAARSAHFEAVKVLNQWAGHFDFNTLDHNAIIGAHPERANFLIATGFSGHGLMHAPAVGRGISELVTHGAYESLDLAELGIERIIAKRPFMERALL